MQLMRKLIPVSVIAATLLACGSIGTRSNQTTSPLATSTTLSPGKPGLDTWMISNECPSTTPEDPRAPTPLAGDFLDTFLGGAVSFVVDKVAGAVDAAAKIDREGRATAGQSPGYLYEIVEAKGKDKDDNDITVTRAVPAMCIVVAISDSSPEEWCKIDPFKGDFICTSQNDSHNIKKQLVFPHNANFRNGNSLPKFYAEIELFTSNDFTSYIPKLRAMYYPDCIHEGRKFCSRSSRKKTFKKRDLSIKVSAQTVDGKSALGTIHLQMRGIIPNTMIITRDGKYKSPEENHPILDRVSSIVWVNVVDVPKKLPTLKTDETKFLPVNLQGEVREVGDPNKFLQAFASILTKNKKSLAEAL